MPTTNPHVYIWTKNVDGAALAYMRREIPRIVGAVTGHPYSGRVEYGPDDREALGWITIRVVTEDEAPTFMRGYCGYAYIGDDPGSIWMSPWASGCAGTYPNRMLAHELGHALGLYHVPDADAVMLQYSWDGGVLGRGAAPFRACLHPWARGAVWRRPRVRTIWPQSRSHGPANRSTRLRRVSMPYKIDEVTAGWAVRFVSSKGEESRKIAEFWHGHDARWRAQEYAGWKNANHHPGDADGERIDNQAAERATSYDSYDWARKIDLVDTQYADRCNGLVETCANLEARIQELENPTSALESGLEVWSDVQRKEARERQMKRDIALLSDIPHSLKGIIQEVESLLKDFTVHPFGSPARAGMHRGASMVAVVQPGLPRACGDAPYAFQLVAQARTVVELTFSALLSVTREDGTSYQDTICTCAFFCSVDPCDYHWEC